MDEVFLTRSQIPLHSSLQHVSTWTHFPFHHGPHNNQRNNVIKSRFSAGSDTPFQMVGSPASTPFTGELWYWFGRSIPGPKRFPLHLPAPGTWSVVRLPLAHYLSSGAGVNGHSRARNQESIKLLAGNWCGRFCRSKLFRGSAFRMRWLISKARNENFQLSAKIDLQKREINS